MKVSGMVTSMTDIILYPTETLYALGVNALDQKSHDALQKLKGRGNDKPPSWLVRDIKDIEKYAELTPEAAKIAEQFLPGPLTLIVPAKTDIANSLIAKDGTVGFRISPDETAQKIIAEFMSEHDAPLTCTSANLSGSPTFSTPSEILQQFGAKAKLITEVYDDGPRKGLASTVVRVVAGKVEVLREGEISEADILEAVSL